MMYDDEFSYPERMRLVEKMLQQTLKKGLHTVIPLIEHKDPAYRFAAVWCIGRGLKIKGEEQTAMACVPNLLALYKREPDIGVKNEIVFALPELGYPQIMSDFIKEARSDPNIAESFKLAVDRYFKYRDGWNIVTGCQERLKSLGYEHKRVLYIFWLGECAQDEVSIELVKQHLSDSKSEVREEAAIAAFNIQERLRQGRQQ